MPAGAAIQGSGADNAAWRALMRDRDLQFQFPDADINTKPPGWLTRLLDFLGRHETGLHWIGWIMLAIVAALALWALARWLWRRGQARNAADPGAPGMAPWQPTARQARLVLHDADALAAQSRFGDAVHMLLLVSIQEISERRHGLVTPALTSREIAALPVLSAMAQRIFSNIARVVEHSRFAGLAIDEEAFKQCRAAYEQFTRPDTWQMAA